jgi:sortase (surface protein transpeptidase)
LITCFPFYYVGAAPERFIVRAHKISITSREPTSP